MTLLNKTNTHSNATRKLIKLKAQERGQARSDEVRTTVQNTMMLIAEEVNSNGGIYPHNNGALSLAEVSRRAGIHFTTLFSPKQRTLGTEVKKWLEEIKTSKAIKGTTVRRDQASRLADWKALFAGLQQSHRDTELDLQHTEVELLRVRKELENAHLDNKILRAELASMQEVTNLIFPRKSK